MFRSFAVRATVALAALLTPSLLAAQSVPSLFTPIQPCRLFDSRFPAGSLPLVAGTTYQIAVRKTASQLEEGACGVPEAANAIFVTPIATGAVDRGYVRLWASDLLTPVSSTFNFRGNGQDSSGTFVRLCAPPLNECSAVDMSIRVELNDSHVILDLVGYTTPVSTE